MSDIQERVRRKLIEVAKDKRLVTYGELGKCVGTTAQGVIKYLDPINCEIESGNPLLTALAVSKGKGRPGVGFFRGAKELCRYDGPESGPEADAFWIREVYRIFAMYCSE